MTFLIHSIHSTHYDTTNWDCCMCERCSMIDSKVALLIKKKRLRRVDFAPVQFSILNKHSFMLHDERWCCHIYFAPIGSILFGHNIKSHVQRSPFIVKRAIQFLFRYITFGIPSFIDFYRLTAKEKSFRKAFVLRHLHNWIYDFDDNRFQRHELSKYHFHIFLAHIFIGTQWIETVDAFAFLLIFSSATEHMLNNLLTLDPNHWCEYKMHNIVSGYKYLSLKQLLFFNGIRNLCSAQCTIQLIFTFYSLHIVASGSSPFVINHNFGSFDPTL